MTDNSNAIKELISKTAGGVITRDAAKQALYEAVANEIDKCNESDCDGEYTHISKDALLDKVQALFGISKEGDSNE